MEQPGPGEYKIKLFDSSAASPASIKLDENGDEVRNNTTSRKHEKRNSLGFQMDDVQRLMLDGTEEKVPIDQSNRTNPKRSSRISSCLNRMSSEQKRPVTLRLQNT